MSSAWAPILVAAAGTYALRVSFLLFADRLVDLPDVVERVLRQIPPAVLAALVLPALLRPGGTLDLWQPRLLAGALAALVSWRTGGAGWTLAAGMGALVLLEAVV